MGSKIDIQKVLIWDNLKNEMVPRFEVWYQVVGNLGTVMFEEGPLFCDEKDVNAASEELAQRFRKKYLKNA